MSSVVTWLQELGVELLGAGPRLPGVLPGADRRVVRLLRLAPGCGRPEHRESVLVIREQDPALQVWGGHLTPHYLPDLES